MSNISSICVYSASSEHINTCYFEAAEQLGKLLAENHIRLINGAGNKGLMNAISNAVLNQGGLVTGIIPKFMIEHNWHHKNLTELKIVDNMHQRKELMAAESDAVIALPGGCGTLEELMEIITWKQLGLYTKPIIILNINHYFDPLITMLEKTIAEGFVEKEHKQIWHVASNPEEAIKLVYQLPEWERFSR